MLQLTYNNFYPNFGANLKSPKLRLSQKDFFVKIRGYGRNKQWADSMKQTTDCAVNQIRNNCLVENVLKLITSGVSNANKIPLDIGKRTNTGILRTKRNFWRSAPEDVEVVTSYALNRYNGYAKRLNEIVKTPLVVINDKLGMSRPNKLKNIDHGPANKVNCSLEYVFGLYNKKFSQYLNKDVKQTDLPAIIDVVAEIRWVLAHATPWMRGSDAISNVFMRAMFKSVGVKSHPITKGVSLDLEAYCRNLKDYKQHFNSFFEKPLYVVG